MTDIIDEIKENIDQFGQATKVLQNNWGIGCENKLSNLMAKRQQDIKNVQIRRFFSNFRIIKTFFIWHRRQTVGKKIYPRKISQKGDATGVGVAAHLPIRFGRNTSYITHLCKRKYQSSCRILATNRQNLINFTI